MKTKSRELLLLPVAETVRPYPRKKFADRALLSGVEAKSWARRVQEHVLSGREVVGLPVIVSHWQFLEAFLPCGTPLHGMALAESATQDFVIMSVGKPSNLYQFFFAFREGSFRSLSFDLNDKPERDCTIFEIDTASELHAVNYLRFKNFLFRYVEGGVMGGYVHDLDFSLLLHLRHKDGRNFDLVIRFNLDTLAPKAKALSMGAVTPNNIDIYNFSRFNGRGFIEPDFNDLALRPLGAQVPLRHGIEEKEIVERYGHVVCK